MLLGGIVLKNSSRHCVFSMTTDRGDRQVESVSPGLCRLWRKIVITRLTGKSKA